jgi:transcriptional regulator with PAS, ATPase and Fis domain
MKVIGRDPEFKYVISLADKLSRETRPVILIGETGTGKSFLARYIHEKGARSKEPFIEWHAGNAPESLIESEILGVDRGVATGVLPRAGIFEASRNGTLCITGIEELPTHTQALFLRLLESGEFEKIGGQRKVSFKGRMIAAFQENPKKLVKNGTLRADLLYRLDVFQIEIPPLRARKKDIIPFAVEFLKRERVKTEKKIQELSGPLKNRLLSYSWPGNVRELENLIRYLSGMDEDILMVDHLPPQFLFSKDEPVGYALDERLSLDELKKMYVAAVLSRVGGKKTAAADWLKISRKTLWEYLKEEKE